MTTAAYGGAPGASFLIRYVAVRIEATVVLSLVLMPFWAGATGAESMSGPAKPLPSTQPPRMTDDWPGLQHAQASAKVWTAPGAPREFDTPTHVKLVGAAAQCSEALASAQWRQDILLQLDASAHFDNCAFDETLKYVAQLLSEADKLLGKPDAKVQVPEAMALLGRALHAIQDFYSHSNYVELSDRPNVSFDEKLVVPIWTQDGAQQVRRMAAATPALVSGRVWWDFPKRCSDAVPSHAELAKDSAKMKAGKEYRKNLQRTSYRAALQLADLATKKFLAFSYARWPVLASTCGFYVEYLPLSDRRPDDK